MIEFIKLSEKSRKDFTFIESGEFLGEFGHINVLIGKNNNGKSRFMRRVLNDEGNILLTFESNQYEFEKIKETFYRQLNVLLNGLARENPFLSDYLILINKLKILSINKEGNFDFFKSMLIIQKMFSNKNQHSQSAYHVALINNIIEKINQFLKSCIREIENLNHYTSNRFLLYIPIMRGLRPLQYENNTFSNLDVYDARTRFDYDIKPDQSNIFTGLSMYEDVKRLLLGTEQERQLISDFQQFLTDNLFNESVTLIPKYDGDVLHIKIGSNEQIEIFNLGDGLQTIITILFPLFVRKESKTIVFIEEPETHLHPEWQSKLLNALKEFKNHQFFISSHSTSFINDGETNVFSIVKEDTIITIDKVNDNAKRSLIFDLGYRPSDLLLANYILWVEGQSDKIYIQKLLEMYASDLQEGLHYTIMLFGGENYRHFIPGEDEIDLSIFKSLNSHFGIILDSDRSSEDCQINDRKQKIQAKFHEIDAFCWVTNKREIENYIPLKTFEHAVRKVHNKSNIKISKGEYDDRNTVCDLDNENSSFKATIKLPEDIFAQIQKNNDGSTKNIDAKKLREAVEDAIQKTKKNTFSIKKIDVAKEVALNEFEIESEELIEKINDLILRIRKAN